MSRIFSTPAAERAAKAFLHDLTLAAGIRTNTQRTGRGSNTSFAQWYIKAATELCNELQNRSFTDVDKSIKELAGIRFQDSLDGTGKYKSFNDEGVAKAIVYFAELLDLYWDDSIKTTYEIAEFKNTILGAAVFKYGRYISAIGKSGATRTRSATPRVQGQAPKNNYKQTGPQSANVRDLLDVNGNPGIPGQKVHSSSGLMFRIIGEFNPPQKNTPNVFIKPLSASGASGSTNKVFFSSGNGYTDCTCFFDDLQDAQTFLDAIIADNKIPANVANPHVVKLKEDPNGYFLVGTEYGMCAINAKKLNEALVECKDTVEEGFAWDKVMENMSKEELADLAKWSRRG